MYLTAACRTALHEELARDSSVFVLGEDIGPAMTGRTQGLAEEFGEERVRDTPICEETFTGIGVGAAAAGMHPVVDLQNSNFIYAAMDQVMNQAAKLRFMMGGSVDFPLTIIATYGGASAAQHSDSLYSQVINGGGVKVVVPSNPSDAKGLLKSAIRDPNPVLFLIHSWLGAVRGDVPDRDDYLVPLGVGNIAREGSDVTVVGIGMMVRRALEAAEALSAEGISVEVVDPRTLFPLDRRIIATSVAKTGRLVVVDEARRSCSVASEIVAGVASDAFETLKQAPVILANPDMHIPYNRSLLEAIIPQVSDIVDAVKKATTVSVGA
jgi:pyruvate dehydrogenase E1 component beta subunit